MAVELTPIGKAAGRQKTKLTARAARVSTTTYHNAWAQMRLTATGVKRRKRLRRERLRNRLPVQAPKKVDPVHQDNRLI